MITDNLEIQATADMDCMVFVDDTKSIPNAETIEAIEESKAFDQGKIEGKVYSSAKDMIADILGEDEE